MSNGYSVKLTKRIEDADTQLLGVRLGQLCVKHDIPVMQVARWVGTSRMSVYKWFVGKADPARGPFADIVAKLEAKLSSI